MKEQDGIRLGGPDADGPNDGMFVCRDCFEKNHEKSEKNRIHRPIEAIECMDCGERCISPLP